MVRDRQRYPAYVTAILASIILSASNCAPEERAAPLDLRLTAGAVLELPEGVEFVGPARVFANHETFAVLDVTAQLQLHLYQASGEFWTTVGPLESSEGDPAPVSAVVFHDDGSIRILSGRGQRAFVLDRDVAGFTETPFQLLSVWDAASAPGTELIVNAPSLQPGAAGQPLHRISGTGEILHSFGRGAADHPVTDAERLRWPIADDVVNGTVLTIDPTDLTLRRFSLSGEALGDPKSAPIALASLLSQEDAGMARTPIIPLKSWEETPDRILNLTWVPRSRAENLGVEVVPCPLPEGHTGVELGTAAPPVSVVDLRHLAERTLSRFAVFDCRLVGILPGGRVYVTLMDEASSSRSVHTFHLELPDS